jgi:anti-anti-sigma regulatory factor
MQNRRRGGGCAGPAVPGDEWLMCAEFCKIAQNPESDSATLVVGLDALEAYQAEAFGEACDRLVATGRGRLIVDLRHLQNLRSCFIGLVIKLADDSTKADRRLAVLAAPRVAQLLRVFASEVGLELRTCEPEAGPPAGKPRDP